MSIAADHSPPAVYRDGKILVVPKSATLPPNCIKCGKPVTGGSLTKTYHWHNPWLFLLIPAGFLIYPIYLFDRFLIGLLVYTIVWLIVRKKADISFAVCERHRRARKRMRWITAVLILGTIPVGGILVHLDLGPLAFFVIVGMVLAGGITSTVESGPLKPVRMDKESARFRGAGDSFLSLLPPPPANLQRAGTPT